MLSAGTGTQVLFPWGTPSPRVGHWLGDGVRGGGGGEVGGALGAFWVLTGWGECGSYWLIGEECREGSWALIG